MCLLNDLQKRSHSTPDYNFFFAFLRCFLGSILVVAIYSIVYLLEADFLLKGGVYSDTKAFVGESCKKCPRGTFVPPEQAPGKHAKDCVACPQGRFQVLSSPSCM